MNPQISTQPSGSQNQFFGTKVSIPGIDVNSAGDNQLIYQNNFSTELYYNSSGIATVLTGLRLANANNNIGTNQQGFYVSQPGVDVTQATNAQLIFNSEQQVLNIISQGTVIVPSHSVGAGLTSTRSGSITYTLPGSYNPVILAYTNTTLGATYQWQGIVPLGITVGSGSNVTIQVMDLLNVDISETAATFSAECYNGGSGSFTAPQYVITYYVLQQQAQ